MKGKKIRNILILFLIGIAALLLVLFLKNGQQLPVTTEEDRRAEQIILSYIETKGLNIEPGTEEYATLMKGILLGEHPELTSKNSTLIMSDIERNQILSYATGCRDCIR
ncbi:MAG: hypothetical protein ROW48_13950 [Bellilinea sp.]|jgi:hypothetical protein